MLTREPLEGDRIGCERATGTVVGTDGATVRVRYDGAGPEDGPCVMLWRFADGTLNPKLTLW